MHVRSDVGYSGAKRTCYAQCESRSNRHSGFPWGIGSDSLRLGSTDSERNGWRKDTSSMTNSGRVSLRSCRTRSPIPAEPQRTTVYSSMAFCGSCDPERTGTNCPSGTANGRACTSVSRVGQSRGVWERVFAELTRDPKNEYLMLDATLVRAHQQAATGKGGAKKGDRTRLWGVPEVD